MKSLVKDLYHSELKRVNWDFTSEESDSSFAAYHWYPARYVPQLPSILINYFSEPGEIVLDPFCGSGTTLVEAYKSGRLCVGIDLNPMAIWITRAKLASYDPKSFSEYKANLTARTQSSLLYIRADREYEEKLRKSVPNLEGNISWYHPTTLTELAAIWARLNEDLDSEYYCVGVTAFSAILRFCCSQEKHWGWICDNVKPKEFLYKNALVCFANKLSEYERAAEDLHSEVTDLQEKLVLPSEIKVIEGDCAQKLLDFEDESFDLIVTSPPYYNMTDYVKSQRLSNLWLAIDTNTIKKDEIGARFRRRNQDPLGGYLASMELAFSGIIRVLKREKFCCLVIGESPHHGSYLDKFESLCSQIGLDLCDSMARNIAIERSLVPSIKTEKILIMKKR